MEKGRYTGRRVDFSPYAVSCFKPHLFQFRPGLGCGATALALLTGVTPDQIALRNGSKHYSDRFMRRFLREHGCEVLLLTQCRVSAAVTRIGGEHVVLVSQLVLRNEGTWGVLYNDYFFHNFGIYSFESVSFLNKPILSAYLVAHPRWRVGLPNAAALAELKAKDQSFILAALGNPSQGKASHS
jgi:hypothetical protein